MKNIISGSNTNHVQEFINDEELKFAYNQNQNPIEGQEPKKIPLQKIFKGKVKVYNTNKRLKHIQNIELDDESELNLISNRMLLFLKFTILFIILIFYLYYSK
jgi:hypothetical protein